MGSTAPLGFGDHPCAASRAQAACVVLVPVEDVVAHLVPAREKRDKILPSRQQVGPSITKTDGGQWDGRSSGLARADLGEVFLGDPGKTGIDGGSFGHRSEAAPEVIPEGIARGKILEVGRLEV